MDFIANFGLFILKVATVLLMVSILILILKRMSSPSNSNSKGELTVRCLNDEYRETQATLLSHLTSQTQKKSKRKTSATPDNPTTYVIDFKSGIAANEVSSLREEITSILSVAASGDELLVRLETGGGLVSAYGLAAAQLSRVKDAGMSLVVSVDKVAASGGYMMACVANSIVAAPLATVGSIGVVSSFPNFNKLLKKYSVDYEQFTAGEYKRTVTMFGENTAASRDKFKEDLENTHQLFVDHVLAHRPSLKDVPFSTGECWYGSKALELGLVDTISTSDEYIVSALKERNVFLVSHQFKPSITQRLSLMGASIVEGALMKLLEKNQRPLL